MKALYLIILMVAKDIPWLAFLCYGHSLEIEEELSQHQTNWSEWRRVLQDNLHPIKCVPFKGLKRIHTRKSAELRRRVLLENGRSIKKHIGTRGEDMSGLCVQIVEDGKNITERSVSPFRGVKRFGIKGKLSPRFISPFEILECIGEVSYRLVLPPQLSHVHDVFHVSLLRGYHYHPLHVASYPFDQIQPDMSLSEEPESILDRQERVMRSKVIPFVKILWKNHPEREATWETEESMRASYPHFFV
ncbi:putative nucleotidyltransferase, ribonuclease H [Tanacetum coccineum]